MPASQSSFFRFCAALSGAMFIALSATGCARVGENAQHAAGKMHNEGEKVDARVRSWFDSNGIGGKGEDEPRQPDTAFCYRTIGDTTCYKRPLPGAENRLTGVQLPSLSAGEDVVPEPIPVRVETVPEQKVEKAVSVPTGAPKPPRELTPQ